MFPIKKVCILTTLILICANICASKFAVAHFTSVDSNSNSCIELGSIKRNMFKDVSMYAYVAKGPELTFGIEIPVPDSKAYDWLQKLSSFPYYNWAIDRKKEIVSMIMPNKSSENNMNLITKSDKNYFKHNKIAFCPSYSGEFFENKSLHLFVAICNNAHIIDKPKKINVEQEKNLSVEAKVNFYGSETGIVWRTHYKNNVDFNTRYYVTTAYTYDKVTKKYIETKRGSWYFYNDADLIIVDLGTTGDIEERGDSWILSPILTVKKYWLYNEMKNEYFGEIDKEAIIKKANYNITFIPSWNRSETLKQSINLE